MPSVDALRKEKVAPLYVLRANRKMEESPWGADSLLHLIKYLAHSGLRVAWDRHSTHSPISPRSDERKLFGLHPLW